MPPVMLEQPIKVKLSSQLRETPEKNAPKGDETRDRYHIHLYPFLACIVYPNLVPIVTLSRTMIDVGG